MMKSVVPIIHVPDVRSTVEWYERMGFALVRANEENGEMDWALVSFGDSEVMFSEGGRPSEEHRREADLYVHTTDVDGLYGHLPPGVNVVEAPHDTFYGMRELIVRDVNRFWVTFGERLPRAS